jgi:hypothetical protein
VNRCGVGGEDVGFGGQGSSLHAEGAAQMQAGFSITPGV